MIARLCRGRICVLAACRCRRSRRARLPSTRRSADPVRIPTSRRPSRSRSWSPRRGPSSSSSTRRPRSALITTATIENSPATNIGDLLRAVPGINVTQVSARDVNITTRGATSTLATSQLALVDGRSDLPRLLRHGDVGPRADQPPRDQADRSHPRPGVRRVGRQRHERRRQRHHQDAARAGGRAAATSVTIGVGGFNRNVDRAWTATPARCST